MDQIKEPGSVKRIGVTIAAMALFCGVCAAGHAAIASAESTADGSRHSSFESHRHALRIAAEPATVPAPASETDEDDKDVPTSQVDKYISVYEAMQKDHSLTVEQAASKQGLTVAQFRSLENKIENDDTLRERVRKALRHTANPGSKESSDED